VLVNQTLAKRIWPGEDPLGKQVLRWFQSPPFRVIGVVGDTRYTGLNREAGMEMYFSQRQLPKDTATLAMRTAGSEALASGIRAAVWSADKDVPVTDFQTMDQVLEASIFSRRFEMMVLAVFAFLALLLAAVGIYGVVSYGVAQRKHEIGIRMALDAGAGEVAATILRETATLAGRVWPSA
jgi:putative ABC transport system permease protein